MRDNMPDNIIKEIDEDEVEIHPSQFFKDYIVSYETPSKDDGVSSTVRVPAFVEKFINTIQRDQVSRIQVVSGMITYGLQVIVKGEWGIPIKDVIDRQMQDSERVLNGTGYNVETGEFSPKYEIKTDKTEHLRIEKSVSRDIGNIKRALKCDRSIIFRHLMIASIMYSDPATMKGNNVENWHYTMKTYCDYFRGNLKTLISNVGEN